MIAFLVFLWLAASGELAPLTAALQSPMTCKPEYHNVRVVDGVEYCHNEGGQ